MNSFRRAIPVLACLLLAPFAWAQELITYPEPMQALSEKWRWALEESANESQAWIVYQFPTTVDERVIGTDGFRTWYNYRGGLRMMRRVSTLSLDALKTGMRGGKQGFSKPAELLLIARAVDGALHSVELGTAATPVDWQGAPVYWLGDSSLSASFRHLGELLIATQARALNASLIRAIALHAHSDRTPYLYSLYESELWSELRPQLLASLSLQHSEDLEQLFLELLHETRTEEETRVVIAALSQYESPVVLETLLDLTNDSRSVGIREEATRALGFFAITSARSRLNEIAWYATDAELREQAVESLARIDDRDANALLLELARNHPNKKTRRDAVEELEDNLL